MVILHHTIHFLNPMAFFLVGKMRLITVTVLILCHHNLTLQRVKFNSPNGKWDNFKNLTISFKQNYAETKKIPKLQFLLCLPFNHHHIFSPTIKNVPSKHFSPPLNLSLWTVQSAEPLSGFLPNSTEVLSVSPLELLMSYITLSRFIWTVTNEGFNCVAECIFWTFNVT